MEIIGDDGDVRGIWDVISHRSQGGREMEAVTAERPRLGVHQGYDCCPGKGPRLG